MAEHQVSLGTPLQNGEMRRVEVDGKAIVLAQVDGEHFAFKASCTHYGGPLDEGVLKGHTVMCPWHHACFDIRNGLRVEPPALNDLATYPVKIAGGQATITIPEGSAAPTNEAGADNRSFVIIGGGAAGHVAAEELRRIGFSGKITIVSAVPTVPVDRPNLSKDYLDGHAKPEWMPLRDKDWYAKRNIELKLDTPVEAVDPKAKTLKLGGGGSLQYDKLLVATGGIPRTLNIPGADLKGVLTLRSMADADAIIEAVGEGKQVVIIGASFIGLEVAAALVGGRKASATVVAPEPIPFAPIFGEEIGKLLQKEHEANGVKFRLQGEVKRFVGTEGHVSGVELGSGETLAADVVIIGVGVRPATDFLGSAGLELHERDRSLKVDAHLRTNNPDIYAAGDIARWDNGTADGLRIEHWRVAQQQGMVAARNMAGQQEDFNDYVPFFWSKQWDITLRSVGHAAKWDEILYRGEVAAKEFVAFFVKDGRLAGAVGCKRDPEMAALEFILQDDLPLTTEQMRNSDFDLVAYATSK
jgi:apoptosis-inducing factor 3